MSDLVKKIQPEDRFSHELANVIKVDQPFMFYQSIDL